MNDFPSPYAGEGRLHWAGFALDRPLVMGVVNVTPDSFSDGGDHHDPRAAITTGRAMIAAGADILDIGGESTRPGAPEVPPEEEQARILPVIRALADEVAISVDTRHAATMAATLAAGARIINDVTALAHDPEAAGVVARAGCPVILMHMRGTPATMQSLARYGDVVAEVADELADRIAAAEAAGIARHTIAVDPGLGFAKTAEHSLELLARLDALTCFGRPIVLGASRKSFIGHIAGEPNPKARGPGSLAAHMWGMLHGAAIIRTHDVPQTRQALAVIAALRDRLLFK